MGLLQSVGVALALVAGCTALESRSAEWVFRIGVLFNAIPASPIAGPVPAIYCYQGSSDNGGLLAYSGDLVGRYRRAAYFVDGILTRRSPGRRMRR